MPDEVMNVTNSQAILDGSCSIAKRESEEFNGNLLPLRLRVGEAVQKHSYSQRQPQR
ncbi:MAG: hypothetical protein HC849_02155 [Oscillatoriales cyanobacterium RU_3_3]|nr:hypothetical protein [Oscillatoriales cyanobacterium RU_3_3]